MPVRADYVGDLRWTATLDPKEVGRWTYSWSHGFADPPYRSLPAAFHVTVSSMDEARRCISAFGEKVEAATDRDRRKSRDLKDELARVVRAVMSAMDPDLFRDSEGQAVLAELRRVRGLFGKSVPDPIPLIPAERRPWE